MAEETMKDFEKEIAESFSKKKQIEDADAGKWEKFAAMLDSKEKVTVKIVEPVKGGCVAYLDDVRAFIPASHLSTERVENLEEYKNKNIEVIVITADPENKKLVLSHRAIDKAAKAAARAEKLAAIKEGEVVKGKVESLKDYGAFVDLGEGINGLLHVSQISYTRIKHPGVVLKEGQEIEVKVLSTENGKISLSMKALIDPPAGMEKEERPERPERRRRDDETDGFKYVEKGQAVTSLGDLLKDIKL